MPQIQTLDLEYESRYKDTTVTQNASSGKLMFEMWERPKELDSMARNALRHIVKGYEVGCLDLLAYNYYKNEKLWWVIAGVNNLINPFRDMFPGQVLYVPRPEDVEEFLSRVGLVMLDTGES